MAEVGRPWRISHSHNGNTHLCPQPEHIACLDTTGVHNMCTCTCASHACRKPEEALTSPSGSKSNRPPNTSGFVHSAWTQPHRPVSLVRQRKNSLSCLQSPLQIAEATTDAGTSPRRLLAEILWAAYASQRTSFNLEASFLQSATFRPNSVLDADEKPFL